MPNYCKLTGKKYSEATIKANLSQAYRYVYEDEPSGLCEGCLREKGVCSAHIIAKSYLKRLHLTSLIWSPELFFRSCYSCNQAVENPFGEAIKNLKNIDRVLEVTKKYDPVTFNKITINLNGVS